MIAVSDHRRSISLALSALFVFLVVSVPCFSPAYGAGLPIGVPEPGFGLHETHHMYAGASGYRDAGNGPFTHYVDNSDPGCQNTGNGSPEQPRCSLPLDLPAGSVVEVHGGPYSNREYPAKKRRLKLQGTAAKPVFVRGVAGPRGEFPMYLDTTFEVFGRYFVVENLLLDGTNIYVGKGNHVNHAALRAMEVRDHPLNNAVNLFGTEMLLLNSHIHHNHGDDRHGVYVSYQSRNVWILGNRIHHNGGDGIQFCHRCESNPPEYVYVGGNEFYSNRENGVDLKYARHVVVSQNRIYKHIDAPKGEYWCFDDNSYCGVFSSGSDGASIVVGSDGGPEDVLILFNEIFDSAQGVRIEEGKDVVVAGNLIHSISRNGLILEKAGQPVHFSNNTLYNIPTGIRQKSGAVFDLQVRNNIFSAIPEPFEIRSPELALGMAVDNNLFWNGGAKMQFRWIDQVTATYAGDFNTLAGRSKYGNRVANPRFQNTGSNNLSLQVSSPAIDSAGNDLVSLDQQYRSNFRGNPGILRDFAGSSRAGCAIDMGAYEARCGEGDNVVIIDPEDDQENGQPGTIEPPENDGEGAEGAEPGGEQSETGGELPTQLVARQTHNPEVSMDVSVSVTPPGELVIPESIEVVAGQSGANWARLSLEGDSTAMTCLYEGNGARGSTSPPCGDGNGRAYHFSHCIDQAHYERYICYKSPTRPKCVDAALPLEALETVVVSYIELGVVAADRCGDTAIRIGF